MLIADTGNDAIRRVLATGVISTLAGLGTPGYSGDGGPALAAQLKAPADVSAAPGGAVLIADAGNGVIRRVSAKGVITTVAGAAPGAAAAAPSTTPAYARSVRLSNPQGVAALPGGGFLIADTGDNVVELVTPGGLLSVVAGIGAPGNAGDGGPAQAAALNLPTRVVATADGGYLILDLGNLVVRRVSPAGTITTVAGSQTTPSTPFGVALNPGGLAQDAAGNVYVVADHQIRRVAPDGTVTTIAGTGECGSAGDGGPAVDATLAQPAGLALTAAGDVLVADIDNGGSAVGNVRRVSGRRRVDRHGGRGEQRRQRLRRRRRLSLGGPVADLLHHGAAVGARGPGDHDPLLDDARGIGPRLAAEEGQDRAHQEAVRAARAATR